MREFIEIQGVKLLVENDRICISVLGILDKATRGPLPFEPESLPVWESLCREPGAFILDIGAYSGLYSMVAAKAGGQGLAFEPLERNRRRWFDNAILNQISGIELRPEAVSDQVGHATITTNLKARGLSSGSSIVKKVGADALKVPTITIDSLNLEHCTAIKIDVERAEPLVLKGAKETLARLKPSLLIEVLGDDEKAAVLSSISGYHVERELDNRNWLMLPD